MRTDRSTLLAFAVAVLLGGMNFVAVRFSNRELPPFEGAALRFGIAAVLFFVYALARGIPLPRGRALVGATAFGLLAFGGAYAFGYWGLVTAPAAVGSLAFALVPLITLLLAAAHGLERVTPRALAGGALAAVGVGIAFGDQLGAAVGVGALLALLAGAVCAAESGVVVKYFPRSHPAATSAAGMAAGTALLLLISLGAGERWGLPSQQTTLLALLYLVASTIALFATSLYVLGRWSASATAYQFVLFPLVTVVTAVVIAGESVGVAFLFGAAIVTCGVAIAASRGSTTPRAVELPRITTDQRSA